MAYVLIVTGLALLFGGGEALVRGGVGLARLLGFSPLLIGLVVISAGTSAPELMVALKSVLGDHPDIAAGNIIGSNIANILLILGVGALIRVLPTAPKVVFRDGAVLFIASIFLVAFAWNGVVTSTEGYWLLGGLLAFMIASFVSDWRRPNLHSVFATRAAMRSNVEMQGLMTLFYIALGIALLYFGATFLLDGSIAVARGFKVSEAFIGLTIVAVGTLLPELAVTIMSAMRRQVDLAIGNLIGSNIFNILGVLGVTAAVHPVTVAPMLAHQDAPIMMAVAALLLVLLLAQWRLSRGAGIILVLCYCAYLIFLASREGLLPLAT